MRRAGNLDKKVLIAVHIVLGVAVCTVAAALFNAAPEIEGLPGRILTFLITGLLIGLVFLIALTFRMTHRIKALIGQFRCVASGDYTVRVKAKGNDELGELGDAFNSMVQALGRAHELLIEKANTDALTGLANHRFFQERLAVESSRASRYGSKLSLLMIDIDHFKLFNDMNGHPAGDQALADIGKIIAKQVRDVDIAARYGGEEFAIILPETGFAQSLILAERLRKVVEQHPFEDAKPQSSKLTLSIGIAEYPAHCSDRASLLRAADGALYQAKTQGRNQTVVFNGESGQDPKPDPHKLYVLLHATDLTTVEALAAAIDAKHGYPAGHSVAIATLATAIGQKQDMSEDELTSLYVASLLRDIGQIAIPDSVLEKSESLSASEKKSVEQHPVLGHAIVQKSPYMAAMLPAILYHHERYDGTGYPEKLSGDSIPLSARIVAAADAYLSMLVDRPYRQKMSVEDAKAEMSRHSGSQFDPEVVDVLLSAADEQLENAA